MAVDKLTVGTVMAEVGTVMASAWVALGAALGVVVMVAAEATGTPYLSRTRPVRSKGTAHAPYTPYPCVARYLDV